MAEKQRANVPVLVAIGSVSTALLFVVVVGLQAWFYSEESREIREKHATAVDYRVKDLILGQEQRINSYRWIDSQKGLAAIPIDRAIEITVDRRAAAEGARGGGDR